MVVFLPSQARLRENIAKEYPVQAVRYLQQHPIPGRMFNDYGFGGYMVWALAPQRKVFIDSRGDIYEQAGVFAAYMNVTELKPHALAVLQSYRIHSCLMHQNSALATLLRSSSDWKEVYKDAISVIFIRRKMETPISS